MDPTERQIHEYFVRTQKHKQIVDDIEEQRLWTCKMTCFQALKGHAAQRSEKKHMTSLASKIMCQKKLRRVLAAWRTLKNVRIKFE